MTKWEGFSQFVLDHLFEELVTICFFIFTSSIESESENKDLTSQRFLVLENLYFLLLSIELSLKKINLPPSVLHKWKNSLNQILYLLVSEKRNDSYSRIYPPSTLVVSFLCQIIEKICGVLNENPLESVTKVIFKKLI